MDARHVDAVVGAQLATRQHPAVDLLALRFLYLQLDVAIIEVDTVAHPQELWQPSEIDRRTAGIPHAFPDIEDEGLALL